MGDIITDSLGFTEILAEKYFMQRDRHGLLALMSPQISWLGTGSKEIHQGLDQASEALTREIIEYDGSFFIRDKSLQATKLSETLCLVYGDLLAIPSDQEYGELYYHLSLICERQEEGMRIVHCNLSLPDSELPDGCYYLPRRLRQNPLELQKQIKERDRQIERFTKYIPGGAHQCYNDEFLTLSKVSESFLTLFGYREEEIAGHFENRFINMIHPEDREGVKMVLESQLLAGDEVELEYRIIKKNQEVLHILDKGRLVEDEEGKGYFYCVLVDITDRVNQQEELRLSWERYQVILDQATDIIFEWDIVADNFTFSSNWFKKFGYDPIYTEVSHRLALSKHIDPEDLPMLLEAMSACGAGKPYVEVEFRIRDKDNHSYWCRTRATTQYDYLDRPIKVIGVIADITTEKNEKQQLLEKAQKDGLTGLYNKTALNLLVEQAIHERPGSSGYHLLLIIDVDNFKGVNDTFGHLCGDALLSEISEILKKHFRVSDIIGRIGGDEFLVYLPEMNDRNSAVQKAETLLQELRRIRPFKASDPISCSIGATFFPHGTLDYLALYRIADYALYVQKKAGKDGVSFFSDEMMRMDFSELHNLSSISQTIDSNAEIECPE